MAGKRRRKVENKRGKKGRASKRQKLKQNKGGFTKGFTTSTLPR